MAVKKSSSPLGQPIEPTYFRWLVWFVSLIAVLVTLPQIYWSYQCRSYGRLCEQAIAAPSAEALKSNLDEVQKTLAQSGSHKIEKFDLVLQSGWFSKDRVDVLASFSDGRSILVDSIKTPAIDDIVFASRPSSGTALLSYPMQKDVSIDRMSSLANIVFYTIKESLIKRTFHLECVRHKLLTPKFEIANLSFADDSNEVEFDVFTNCHEAVLQGAHKLEFSPSIGGEDGYYYRSGDRLKIKLGADFQLLSVESVRAAALAKKAADSQAENEKNREDCIKESMTDASKSGDKFFTCGSTSWDHEGARTFLSAFEVVDKTPEQIGSDYCVGSLTTSNTGKTAGSVLVSICSERGGQKDKEQKKVELAVFARGVETKRVALTCECERLDVSHVRESKTGNGVIIEIRTSKNEISVDERPLKISDVPPSQHPLPYISDVSIEFLASGIFDSAELIKQIQ